MSTTTYKPRKGALAHSVHQHLVEAGEGAQISVQDIVAQFGGTQESVITQLRSAVNNRLLDFTKVVPEGAAPGTRPVRFYRLAGPEPEAEPTDGPLSMARYSDGDVAVKGMAVGEDGTAMFTRQQLQELVDFVTQPAAVVRALTT
ncbi:MAG TPA: hypothetical protein VGE22_12505 [Solimonas sp.]